MGIIYPTTYQDQLIQHGERIPAWNATTENTYVTRDGNVYCIEGDGRAEYLKSSDYWDGGYAYIRMELTGVHRSSVGLSDIFGNVIRYGIFRDENGELGVREDDPNFNENALGVTPKHYQRILMGQRYNDGFPLYQHSDDLVNWETFYESDQDPSQFGPLTPFVLFRNRQSATFPVEIFNIYISTGPFGFHRMEGFERESNLDRVQHSFQSTATLHETSLNSYEGSRSFHIRHMIGGGGGIRRYAWLYPKWMKGGKRPFKVQWRMYETSDSFGGGMGFYSSDGTKILEVGSDNPDIYIWNPNKTNVGITENTGEWNLFEVYFDWVNGQFTLFVYDNVGNLYGRGINTLNGGAGQDLEYVTFISTNPVFNDNRSIDNYYDAIKFIDHDGQRINESFDFQNEDADYYQDFHDQDISEFTINDPNFEIKSFPAYKSGFSVGINESSTSNSDVALYEPQVLSGGSQPYFLGLKYYPTTVPMDFGADFNGTSGNRLSAGDNADFEVGSQSLYVCAWVYLRDLDSFQTIFRKGHTSLNNREWGIYYSDTVNAVYFYVSTDGQNFSGEALGINPMTWTFVEGIKRGSSDIIEVTVAPHTSSSILSYNSTISHSGSLYTGDGELTLGSTEVDAARLDGMIDNAFVYVGPESGLPTDPQRQQIFNSGNGLSWSEFDSQFNGTDFHSGIQGFWELEESSGTRVDSSPNGNDLSEVGSVGRRPGIVSDNVTAGFSLVNSNGDDEVAVMEKNGYLRVYDERNSNGYQMILYEMVNESWVDLKFWFDWDSGIYKLVAVQRDGNSNEDRDVVVASFSPGVDIERLKVRNLGGNDWDNDLSTGPMEVYLDRFKINDTNI